MQKKTLYEVLGVPETASQEELRQALDKIRNSVVSPTSNVATGDAENRVKFAHQAFSILGNPTSRAQYDARLGRDRELSAQIASATERPEASGEIAERVRELTDELKSGPNSRLYLLGGLLFVGGFAAALAVISFGSDKPDSQAVSASPARMSPTDRAAAQAAGQAAEKWAELVAIRDEALSSVKGELIDQFSAQFRGLYYYPDAKLDEEPATIVCGQVNAKNRFGGYVGWKDWIYVDGKSYIDGPESEVSTVLAGVYLKLCNANEKAREYLPSD